MALMSKVNNVRANFESRIISVTIKNEIRITLINKYYFILSDPWILEKIKPWKQQLTKLGTLLKKKFILNH